MDDVLASWFIVLLLAGLLPVVDRDPYVVSPSVVPGWVCEEIPWSVFSFLTTTIKHIGPSATCVEDSPLLEAGTVSPINLALPVLKCAPMELFALAALTLAVVLFTEVAEPSFPGSSVVEEDVR